MATKESNIDKIAQQQRARDIQRGRVVPDASLAELEVPAPVVEEEKKPEKSKRKSRKKRDK